MENKVNQENKEKAEITNIIVILTALIFGALSAVMLFVPQVEILPAYLCYVLGAAVIIFGLVQVVRYFMTDAYRNVNEYGFSLGVLMLILGICIMLRADVISGVIDLVLGIVVLLMGIIMLQHSLDLKRMSDIMWGLVIVIAALVIACGVVLILKPSPIQISYDSIIWWIVFISSALGLLTNIYTMIRVAVYKHREKKQDKVKKDKEPADDTGSGPEQDLPVSSETVKESEPAKEPWSLLGKKDTSDLPDPLGNAADDAIIRAEENISDIVPENTDDHSI